ncbi:MAG TPA: hypothetical protein VFX17_01050 [Patescibacteria group bacterium]|nr:hypothetical protein [Patescibacteria group bacterium]
MKTIILILIIGFAVIYWRGTKAIFTQAGMDCDWHAVYAICKEPSNNPQMPNIMEILKAGAKLKN